MAEEFQPDYYVKKRSGDSPVTLRTYGWGAIALGLVMMPVRLLTSLDFSLLIIALMFVLGIILVNIEKLMNARPRASP